MILATEGHAFVVLRSWNNVTKPDRYIDPAFFQNYLAAFPTSFEQLVPWLPNNSHVHKDITYMAGLRDMHGTVSGFKRRDIGDVYRPFVGHKNK